MIRAAGFSDIPRMRAILREGYERTRYATDGFCGFDADRATELLGHGVGQAVHGRAFAEVAEVSGQVEGFLVGVLDRVYGVGTKLWATDLYWIATKAVDPRDPVRLMKRFIAWGKAHPDVVEVVNGTTSALGDPDETGRILERLGMTKRGNLYTMRA